MKRKKQRERLGSILIKKGLIHPYQLDRAIWCQVTRWPQKRIGRILVALGMISTTDLYSALCYQNNLPDVL